MLMTAACATALFMLPATAHATGTNCSSGIPGYSGASLCNTTNGSGMTVNFVAARLSLDSCAPSGWFTYRHVINNDAAAINIPGMPAGVTVWQSPAYSFYHQRPSGCAFAGSPNYYLPRVNVNQKFPTSVKRSCVILYKGEGTNSANFLRSSCNGVSA